MGKIKPAPVFSVGDFGPGGAGAHVTCWGPDGNGRAQASQFSSDERGNLWRWDWRPPVRPSRRCFW